MAPKIQMSREDIENRLNELEAKAVARFPKAGLRITDKATLKALYSDTEISDLIRLHERNQ